MTGISATVRENAFVGFNLGDGGSGQLTECKIHANGMHGIQCTGGSLQLTKSTVTKASKLGIFVNPPAAPPGPKSVQDEQRRANVTLEQVEVTGCGMYGVHITGGFLAGNQCDVTQSGSSGMVAKGGHISFSNSSLSDNSSYGVSYSDQRDAEVYACMRV